MLAAMFRFAVVTVEGEELGPFAFARGDFNPGDLIPRGPGQSLEVINVVPTDGEDRLPLLIVEQKGIAQRGGTSSTRS